MWYMGFPALDMSRESRGERIFSVCLQRSVFLSTICWEVPYLAKKKKKKLLQHKEQKILSGLKCYARESLSVFLFCSINIWVLPMKKNWLNRKDTQQIQENISIYPNTPPNISVFELFPLMVGNTNSSLSGKRRGGSLLCFIPDKHFDSWT